MDRRAQVPDSFIAILPGSEQNVTLSECSPQRIECPSSLERHVLLLRTLRERSFITKMKSPMKRNHRVARPCSFYLHARDELSGWHVCCILTWYRMKTQGGDWPYDLAARP
jgi:hypothetical protein